MHSRLNVSAKETKNADTLSHIERTLDAKSIESRECNLDCLASQSQFALIIQQLVTNSIKKFLLAVSCIKRKEKVTSRYYIYII